MDKHRHFHPYNLGGNSLMSRGWGIHGPLLPIDGSVRPTEEDLSRLSHQRCGLSRSKSWIGGSEVLPSFQLSKLPKSDELHFALHGQVTDFPTEANSPPNRWAMVDDELS